MCPAEYSPAKAQRRKENPYNAAALCAFAPLRERSSLVNPLIPVYKYTESFPVNLFCQVTSFPD
jgi:hypothetical protein